VPRFAVTFTRRNWGDVVGFDCTCRSRGVCVCSHKGEIIGKKGSVAVDFRHGKHKVN
jgi:hypothetical protein